MFGIIVSIEQKSWLKMSLFMHNIIIARCGEGGKFDCDTYYYYNSLSHRIFTRRILYIHGVKSSVCFHRNRFSTLQMGQ